MKWAVEFTNEFESWWESLSEKEQDSIDPIVLLLGEMGPQLEYPYSSGIHDSRHSHMRELRIQHKGNPYRVLYAFDPIQNAILLIGGDKTGDDRWYAKMVPVADKLYDEHLEELREEGLTP